MQSNTQRRDSSAALRAAALQCRGSKIRSCCSRSEQQRTHRRRSSRLHSRNQKQRATKWREDRHSHTWRRVRTRENLPCQADHHPHLEKKAISLSECAAAAERRSVARSAQERSSRLRRERRRSRKEGALLLVQSPGSAIFYTALWSATGLSLLPTCFNTWRKNSSKWVVGKKLMPIWLFAPD